MSRCPVALLLLVLVSGSALARKPEVVARQSGSRIAISVGATKLVVAPDVAQKMLTALQVAGAAITAPKAVHDKKQKMPPKEDRERVARAHFLKALKAHDKYSFRHSIRVAIYAVEIAKAMEVDQEGIDRIKQTALMHDIGKLGIPPSLINAGILTDRQLRKVKKHPTIGAEIIKSAPRLRAFAGNIESHHERLDRQGYPNRLGAAELTLVDKIIAVADTFDAMTSNRSYHAGISRTMAIKALRKASRPLRRSARFSSHKDLFDRLVVNALDGMLPQSKRACAALNLAKKYPVHRTPRLPR